MQRLLVASLIVGVLFTSSCSRHSELHEAMKTMGDAFKTMRQSSDLETISDELSVFSDALMVAKSQSVKPEHQAQFDEGMLKMTEITRSLQTAVSAKDNQLAAENLQELAELRKKFHESLGVK